MKKIQILVLFAALIIAGSAEARKPRNSFERVMRSYEPIRISLAQGSLWGVQQNAAEISTELQHLRKNITAGEAGVELGDGMLIFAKLEQWDELARQLAKTSSVEEARRIFEALSLNFVQWRELQERRPKTVIVSCPETGEVWLQAKKTRKHPRSPFACSHPGERDQVRKG